MSKKLFLTMMAALLYIVSASAQDIILKRDASEIEAKVLEISDTELRYKSWTDIEGPTRIINVSEIFWIKYSDGSKELFNVVAEEKGSTSSGVDEYPYPKVSRAYSVGDIFNEDGLYGIVIRSTDDGKHGLIMSLDESPVGTVWDAARVTLFYMGLDDREDGWKNMQVLAKAVDEQRLSWNDFPAFNYCRTMGDGWYLPAVNEIMSAWNLVEKIPWNSYSAQRYMKDLSEVLTAAGGLPMHRNWFDCTYLSSTEYSATHVYKLSYKDRTGHLALGHKQNHWTKGPSSRYVSCVVRAVHKF